MITEALTQNDADQVEVLVDPSTQAVCQCVVAPGMGVLYRYHPDTAQRLVEGFPRFMQAGEGRLVLARFGEGMIVGYVVIAKPDRRERWGKAGVPDLWELAIIEVARGWRQRRVGRKLLDACFADGAFEDRLVLATAYAWHWDLEGTGLSKAEYRALLSRFFGSVGFKPLETDEPNVQEDPANRFFVRIGSRVNPEAYAQFVAPSWMPVVASGRRPPWRSIMPSSRTSSGNPCSTPSLRLSVRCSPSIGPSSTSTIPSTMSSRCTHWQGAIR